MNTKLISAIIIVVLAVAAGAYFLLFQNGESETAQSSAEPYELVSDFPEITEMQLGNSDAPVTVIEYASYTCPHCADFHRGPFNQLKTEYIDTGKINFVYREVYFDSAGLWASAIARCAGPIRFFGMTDLLYEKQAEWARAGGGDPSAVSDELRKLARLAGIEEDTLESCLMDEAQMQKLVEWYQSNARRDDITSTPSFVVNGQKMGNVGYNGLRDAIEGAMPN